jgi:peptide/nickel transport system substrate-binding protein
MRSSDFTDEKTMKRIAFLFSALLVVLLAVISCAPPPSTTTPVVVRETVQVPVRETVQVTVEAIVTATPAPTPSPKKGGTLIVARAEDAKGLDPHKQTAPASLRILELIYDPLLAFDKDMRVVPNLAESWKWSDDSKTITMTLRKNVKFHNGDLLTADDVKYSFERILDEKTGAAARASLSDIDKVDAPDSSTVVFRLKKVNASIMATMAQLNSAIVSKKFVTNGGNLNIDAMGTGAFKLVKWDPGRTLTLTANKDFWIPGLPRLDGIEVRTVADDSTVLAGLRAKTYDWAVVTDARVAFRSAAGSSTLALSRAPSLGFYTLQLNSSRKVLNDVRVRQAIACAIDRQEVLDVGSFGEGEVTGPATQPYYRANLGDLFCYKKDWGQARQLLTDAGKATGLKIKILVPADDPILAADAQDIQAQLRKAGIEVDLETPELGVFVDRWQKGDFDAAVVLFGGAPDPDAMLYNYWHSTGTLNRLASYNSPELDRLLEQGRTTIDAEKRKPIYDQIQKKLTEAAPWIWLYVGYEYRVMQQYVKGYTPLSNGSVIYLREAWMDK